LVTGATGLLGRAVFKEFNENNWNAVGCGYRRAQPRFEQVNLLDSVAVHNIIHDFQVSFWNRQWTGRVLDAAGSQRTVLFRCCVRVASVGEGFGRALRDGVAASPGQPAGGLALQTRAVLSSAAIASDGRQATDVRVGTLALMAERKR